MRFTNCDHSYFVRDPRVRTPPAPSKLPDHVIGVFSRVLVRNRETQVGHIVHEENARGGLVEVRFRGNVFILNSFVVGSTMSVTVTKKGADAYSPAFFRYSCPVNRLGRLRKTALILQKKMSLVEVYEVMNE